MNLKCKKETVFTVDYTDLDDFINHHFPDIEFEFASAEEASNDSSHRFDVTGEVNEYYDASIKAGETLYMAEAYLNKLCYYGYIEKGTYIVEVCW